MTSFFLAEIETKGIGFNTGDADGIARGEGGKT